MSQLTNTIITSLTDKIANLVAIYIFGSFGTEYEDPNSDIDIAILVVSGMGQDNLSVKKLALELGVEFNRDVDLINLNTAATVFQHEIINSGRRVFCNDINFCDNYETYIDSKYIRFNESRAELLQDIQSRGSIY